MTMSMVIIMVVVMNSVMSTVTVSVWSWWWSHDDDRDDHTMMVGVGHFVHKSFHTHFEITSSSLHIAFHCMLIYKCDI